MIPRLTITIRRRKQTEKLIWLLVVMPLCIGALAELSPRLYAARYLIDVVWLFLLVLMLRFKRRIPLRGMRPLLVWTVLFFLYTLLAYIPQYQSGIYYLWGVRNNFRFYVAFFAFAAFLTEKDIEEYFKIYEMLFWVNFVVSLIQFFFYDLGQDYLGGIFGASQGTNGYSNTFMAIILTRSVIFYLNNRESAARCISKCVAGLLVAAMAEMKFFFFVFIVIVVMASLFTGFLWKKILVIAGGFVAALAGAALLTVFFPYFTDWFSISWFWETASSSVGYTGGGDLNRLTAVSDINDLWLMNLGQRLVGLGMGNCETAAYDFLNTPFFRQYGNSHYTWIAYAMLYLECGWIGLVFYAGFFVMVYYKLCTLQKTSDKVLKHDIVMAKIAVVLCIMTSVYNNTMRAEPAYMLYFVLAVPFAYSIRNRVST